MSARAFSGIPRTFAKACRFQRMNVPRMNPKVWKQAENYFDFVKQVRQPMSTLSRSFDEMVIRCKTMEMKRIQIGALYMFSYITQELVEEMERCKDMLSEEELKEEEELTTVTTTTLRTRL